MMNQWLEDRCWSNYPLIKGDICAVALNFNGLGGGVCTQWYPLELGLAEKNILTVTPYYGPWSWMNRQSRMFVDELVERVYSDLQLAEDIPLVSCGGSMGGCASLLYCRYGKKAPIACDALYPVCDVKWHFRERSDIAPSMCRAFYGYDAPWEEVLEEQSPLCQVEFMPHIPYLFIHGEDDQAVNIGHSEKMTAALLERGHQVEFIRVPNMGHARNVPLQVWQKRIDFVVDAVKNYK